MKNKRHLDTYVRFKYVNEENCQTKKSLKRRSLSGLMVSKKESQIIEVKVDKLALNMR